MHVSSEHETTTSSLKLPINSLNLHIPLLDLNANARLSHCVSFPACCTQLLNQLKLCSFIHSGYLYSAPSRNLLRGALSPATVTEKCDRILNSYSVPSDPLEIGLELTTGFPLDNPFDSSHGL